MKICKLTVVAAFNKLKLHKQQYRSIYIIADLGYACIVTSTAVYSGSLAISVLAKRPA